MDPVRALGRQAGVRPPCGCRWPRAAYVRCARRRRAAAGQARRYASTARSGGCSSPGGQTELVEDARDVLLHGALGDVQPLADRLVRAALGDQLEHLALARRERVAAGRRRRALRAAGDDLRVERGAAGGDAAQRAGEVVGVGDAVLEQVAEPCGALGQQLHREADLDVLGEEHDRRSPGGGARISCAAWMPSSVWVGGMRMSTIATSGSCSSTACEQLVGVGRLARRPRCPRRAAKRRDALAQQQAVVGDHDAHGSSAVTTVPAGRAEDAQRRRRARLDAVGQPSEARCRPTRRRRRRRRRRSRSRRAPFRRETRTDALVACAYLATLASASQATK